MGPTNHLLSSKHISRKTLSQTMHKNTSFVYLANVTGPVRRDSFGEVPCCSTVLTPPAVVMVYPLPESQFSSEESGQWPKTPPLPGRDRARGQEDIAEISG